MPNQRSKEKAFLGVFLDRQLRQRVTGAAKAQGLTVTAFVSDLLSKGLADQTTQGAGVDPAASGAHQNSPIPRPTSADTSKDSASTSDEEVWML